MNLLSTQHREVLARLAALETALSGGAAPDLGGFLGFLENEVVEHFDIEERALFPLLARHLGMEQGPLAVMNAEHASFRECLAALAHAIRTRDPDRQRICADELIELLRDHIAKEDHVLFPMAARLLSPEEQREVDERANLDSRGASLA